MEFNVSRVCRVCMQDGVYDILTSIFANDDYSQTYISNKIMACAAVEVHEGDGLPSLICHKCTEKVNIAYQFKQECESSDQVLRELIEKNSKGAIFQNYRPSSTPQVDQSVTQNVTDVNVLLKLESLNADLGAEMEIANNETVGNDDFDSSHDSIDDEQYIDTINDPTSIVYELNIDNNVFEENNTTTEETITDEMIPNAEMNAVVDNKQEQPLKRRTRRLPKKLASDNEEEPVAVRKKSIKIKCRVCGVSMSSNSMSMHMKKVHNEQAVFCKICLKQFSEKTGLAGHMKSHAKTKLCCQVCEAVFFSPAKLYLHMQRIHHNIEQQAVILGSIEQDLLAINTKKSKPRKHVCHCGHAVLTPAKLAVHMRTHSRERPFLCTLCPKNFSEKSSLASHMLTHGGQKNFHCKDCGRGFTHSSALRIHQRIHNGELPHTCSHCQRRFRSSGDMNEHIRRAHTFERPFCCRYCKLTFVSSSDLARHTRRHTSRPVKTNNKSKAETITVNQQIENDSNYEQQYNLQQPQHELLDNENIFNLHTFESNLEHLYIKHDLGKDNTSTMKTKAKTKRSKSSRRSKLGPSTN